MYTVFHGGRVRCVGIGRTGKNSKEIKFYGLKKRCSYIVRALLSKDKVEDLRFTCSNGMEMQHAFKIE